MKHRLQACLFPAGTFEGFAQKLYTTHSKHARFSKPKMSNTAFTLNHYAGAGAPSHALPPL